MDSNARYRYRPIKKFIEVRAYLSQAGVSVPRIIAVDKNAGLALLQDFGDNTYLNIIGNEKTCYAAAWRALIKIQRLPKKSCCRHITPHC